MEATPLLCRPQHAYGGSLKPLFCHGQTMLLLPARVALKNASMCFEMLAL
jgi:hypothetical protein